MATIEALYRSASQPAIQTTGATTSGSETWIMKVDSSITTVQADALVRALGSNNSFDFTVIGSVHPDNASLQILSLSTIQIEVGKKFTEYLITSNFSNDKNDSDNDVDPAKAQASYSYDSIDYEVIVTETQGASKATAGVNLGITAAGQAIQNSARKGIIVTETEQLQQITIVRNMPTFSISEAAKHVGRVNSGTVKLVGETFKAGRCKLDRWSAQDAYDVDGKLYYRVTYVISVAEEEDFFERKLISRGTININGNSPPAALGLLDDTEYKLKADGTFYKDTEQIDPTEYFAISYVTKKSSDWGVAVGLQATPNSNIIILAHGDGTFGLQDPFGGIIS